MALLAIRSDYKYIHRATCIFGGRGGRTPHCQTNQGTLDMFQDNQCLRLDGGCFAYPKSICRGHLRQLDTPLLLFILLTTKVNLLAF